MNDTAPEAEFDVKNGEMSARRQALFYLQASVIGTVANFLSRFPLAELFGFEVSVVLATYVGMVIVFVLSFRRAFGVRHVDMGMILRFVIVSHVGLAVVWVGSTLALTVLRLTLPDLLQPDSAINFLEKFLPVAKFSWISVMIPRLAEGGCHAFGIILGFLVNFFGHRLYSFAGSAKDHSAPDPEQAHASALFAILIPLAYLALYAPYGMDTTDFGFFYGHPWRILQGEVPFRDFYYTKPPVSLYWHSFWLWLMPERLSVLSGKAGFLAEMLGNAWLGSLFLHRIFAFSKIGISLPLLATTSFVFSVHTFPAMPWHTADGTLFGAMALWFAVCGKKPDSSDLTQKSLSEWGYGLLAGLFAGFALLTKQSFLFIPLAALLVSLLFHSRIRSLAVFLGTALFCGIFVVFLWHFNALKAFLEQTTGGLGIQEALEAGIFIYLRQNLTLPGAAILAAICFLILTKLCFKQKKALSYLSFLQPVPAYFLILAIWYIYTALNTPEWIGYGTSWPTLFVLLGGVVMLLPQPFLTGFSQEKIFAPALGLGAALLLAWSTGISGGYKTPAFFATPLLFTAILLHRKWHQWLNKCVMGNENSQNVFHGNGVLWLILISGLVMFRVGYERPYVFPVRDMPRSSLSYDAGSVFPRMTGVLVDQQSLEILQELRDLRAKYGANYKTLPGFPLAYFLTGDKPALPAEWLQDWEINGECEKVYQLLKDRNIVVFFERSQLDILSPDGYARTKYTVPNRVRHEWQQIEETKHFVVFRKPS